MKKRILSSIIMILICLPLIISGGKVFFIAFGLLAMLALKELLDLKQTHSKFSGGLILYSIFCLACIIFYEYEGYSGSYSLSYRLLILLLLGYFLPALFPYQKDKYEIKDAFILFGMVLFLGLAFNSFLIIRTMSLNLTWYILLIALGTDTFALLGGTCFGKHKLVPSISPGKTIEGGIFGIVFSTFLSTFFYAMLISSERLWLTICISIFLSIVAQFGDLFFSKLKRENNIKDYGKLIPGHGGVLDRIDSVLFVSLVYFVLLRFL